MKKISTILFQITFGILLTASVFAQPPEKMNYQAVVRNSSDALVTSTQIGMQISILQGSATGIVVYIETQTPTTNASGLVSIEIGAGTLVSGDFAAIDWVNGPYFIKTETDLTGGNSYTVSGTSQLLSVPFALHSKTAETVTGSIFEIDPAFTGSEAANITAVDVANLKNLSGTNTGDQDISEIAVNTEAIKDIATQIDDLATVATSGNYDDLLDQPNIVDSINMHGFDGQYSSLTGIPIYVSSFKNDAGYLKEYTESDPSVPSGTQPGEMQYWDGSAWITVAPGNTGQILTFINGVPTWGPQLGMNDVQNPTTGKIWMDRNLGASQVATSNTDAAAYGDLYQWGRATDGHEKRNSSTTYTLSNSDTPGHGMFIISSSLPYDWRSPQNDNLWQGVNGINNPCPVGYRLPTMAECQAELLTWSSNDAAGAFASPLKLPIAGTRKYNSLIYNTEFIGSIWTSTLESSSRAWSMNFYSTTDMSSLLRGYANSVRCIKD